MRPVRHSDIDIFHLAPPTSPSFVLRHHSGHVPCRRMSTCVFAGQPSHWVLVRHGKRVRVEHKEFIEAPTGSSKQQNHQPFMMLSLLFNTLCSRSTTVSSHGCQFDRDTDCASSLPSVAKTLQSQRGFSDSLMAQTSSHHRFMIGRRPGSASNLSLERKKNQR